MCVATLTQKDENRCLLELLSYPVLFTFLQHKCYLISRITGKLIKWLLVVINTLSIIICHIFYIVFHKLQLVLTVNSSLIQKFCFSLFWSLPTACVWFFFLDFFFSFSFISWRLITLQYCTGFCHTLTWISHGFICVPHPDPPSCLPPHLISLGLGSAPALSTCLMHPTWAGDLFHPW